MATSTSPGEHQHKPLSPLTQRKTLRNQLVQVLHRGPPRLCLVICTGLRELTGGRAHWA